MDDHGGRKSGGGTTSWLLLAGLAVLLVAVFATGAQDRLSPRALVTDYAAFKDFVAAHRGPAVGLYALIYVVAVALSVPGGLVLTVAGGLFFGWQVGGLVTILSATLGATLLFLLARTTLGAALAARAGPRLEALRDGFREDAASYLLFLRLVPLFPFWLVNLAPALLGVGLRVFVVTTLVGIAPASFAFTVIGSGLDSVVAGQAEALRLCERASGQAGNCTVSLDLSTFVTPGLLAAFAALGVIALIPAVVKRVWRPRAARRTGGAHG